MRRRLRRSARALAAVVLTLGLAGMTAGHARADWRGDYPVLRVGILVGSNAPYRLAQAEPFRKYLADALGVQVELVPAANYAGLIGAQVDSSLPLAFLSAAAFAAAEAECRCVEPLVVPVGLDGSRGFHAVLLARAGSPIRSLADAAGARLALSQEDSLGGRMLPLRLLADEGFTGKDVGALVTVAEPRAAVTALIRGETDLAIAWSTLTGDPEEGYGGGVLTDMVADGSLSMSAVRIVWSSPLIPYGPLSILVEAPDELKLLVRGAMLDLARSDPDALDAIDRTLGGGFVAGEASLYEPLRRLVAAPAGG